MDLLWMRAQAGGAVYLLGWQEHFSQGKFGEIAMTGKG